jgi:hypothetical protein
VHREPDDGLDASEVLPQHHEFIGEHYLGEVVEGGSGQKQRLERLLAEMIMLKSVNFGVLDECRARTDLLIIAHYQDLLAAQQRRQFADTGEVREVLYALVVVALVAGGVGGAILGFTG